MPEMSRQGLHWDGYHSRARLILLMIMRLLSRASDETERMISKGRLFLEHIDLCLAQRFFELS